MLHIRPPCQRSLKPPAGDIGPTGPAGSGSGGSSLAPDTQYTLYVSPVWNAPVDTATHFTTVEAALTAASTMTGPVEIFIYPGTYSETIIVNQTDVFLTGIDQSSVNLVTVTITPTISNIFSNINFSGTVTVSGVGSSGCQFFNCTFNTFTSTVAYTMTFTDCSFETATDIGPSSSVFNTSELSGTFTSSNQCNFNDCICENISLTGQIIIINNSIVYVQNANIDTLTCLQSEFEAQTYSSNISSTPSMILNNTIFNVQTISFTSITSLTWSTIQSTITIDNSFALTSSFSWTASECFLTLSDISIPLDNNGLFTWNECTIQIFYTTTNSLLLSEFQGAENDWTLNLQNNFNTCLCIQANTWVDLRSSYAILPGSSSISFMDINTQCNLDGSTFNFTQINPSIIITNDTPFFTCDTNFSSARNTTWFFYYELIGVSGSNFNVFTLGNFDFSNSVFDFGNSSLASGGVFFIDNTVYMNGCTINTTSTLTNNNAYLFYLQTNSAASKLYLSDCSINSTCNTSSQSTFFINTLPYTLSIVCVNSVFTITGSHPSLFTMNSGLVSHLNINFLNSVYNASNAATSFLNGTLTNCYVDQKISGSASISTGTSVAVTFVCPQVDANYLVYATPTSDINGALYITNVTQTGFTINCSVSGTPTIDWVVVRTISTIY